MLWLKACHLFFVVCWFAGIFYLPRILVNFAACEQRETRVHLAGMAHRLYRFVTPFMYLTIGFGVALITTNPDYYLHAGWLWLKLLMVAALVAYHFVCGNYVKAVVADNDDRSQRYYRFFNEIPVLFLLAIVLLAVLKPF